MEEKTKVWISKYALSGGITEHIAEIRNGYAYPGSQFARFFGFTVGKDAHLTREGAVAAAELMRKNKLDSMKKQIYALTVNIKKVMQHFIMKNINARRYCLLLWFASLRQAVIRLGGLPNFELVGCAELAKHNVYRAANGFYQLTMLLVKPNITTRQWHLRKVRTSP